jgi:NADH:ubiquinone oxidoreductase subunit F (NADH-binding)
MSGPSGLPRVLAGCGVGRAQTLAEHERGRGPLPQLSTRGLIDVVERSGLRGRGGADFPTAVKLQTVAARRKVSAVVVNGSETEPLSRKDAMLLRSVPHLVIDGAVLCSRAVEAEAVFIMVSQSADAVIVALQAAIAERPAGEPPTALVLGADRYVAGEESAVMHQLENGTAKPTLTPPRPFEKGYRGRPTLIQNVETLAQIALIARYGPDWYRELGTPEDPGTALLTVSGAVTNPGVYELGFGTSIGDLVDAAGGASEPLQAVLIGGYFGTWLSFEAGRDVTLERAALRAHRASLGAGVLSVLPVGECGLRESARIMSFLAEQSAGQCGPCEHGLRAIADVVDELAAGDAPAGTVEQIRRWCGQIYGRGACHHPNGATKFILSALEVFEHEIAAHQQGRCIAGAVPVSRRQRQAV